jgi:hypothetical protein
MIYRVDAARNGGADAGLNGFSLSRIRLGTTGIQDLHEGAITLTAVPEE